MDYIQEELRRQREALARLLLGGTVPEETREDGRKRAGENIQAPPAGRETLDSAGVFFPETAGEDFPEAGSFFEKAGRGAEAAWPEAGRRTAGRDGARPLPLPAEAGERGFSAVYGGGEAETAFLTGMDGGGEMLPEAGERPGRWAQESLGVRRRSFHETAERRVSFGWGGLGGGGAASAGAPAEDGTAPARTVTEILSPAGGTAEISAGDLSRIVQRDARRYDGAFELF